MDDELEDDVAYLRDLAERIFRIPVMHGVNQLDYDRLREIAQKLDKDELQRHAEASSMGG